jgi:hypothetical protein
MPSRRATGTPTHTHANTATPTLPHTTASSTTPCFCVMLPACLVGPNAPWATISAALAGGVRVVVRGRDVKDKRGNTLLHFAVSAPEGWPVAQAALAQGAHPDAANAVGSTPLMNAVAAGMVHAVRGLFAAGASVNAVSSIGMSPVHALRGAPVGTDLACLSALLVQPGLEMQLPMQSCSIMGVDTLREWATRCGRHALATMVQEEVMCGFHLHRLRPLTFPALQLPLPADRPHGYERGCYSCGVKCQGGGASGGLGVFACAEQGWP